MNTIQKYCNKFNVDYLPILNHCADVDKTFSTTRKKVVEFEFPNAEYFSEAEISVAYDGIANTTSYFELTSIPSEITIDSALKTYFQDRPGSTWFMMGDKIFSPSDIY